VKKINTSFKGLFLIKTKIFHDKRGFFKEVFLKKIIKKSLVFGCLSKSKKNVLRGLHLQLKRSQGKFITVVKGKIFDVALDLRKKSKTYGKVFKIVLSEKDNKSVFIPEGFAHGFLGLSNENIIYYLCTNYRSKDNEIGILWNDKNLKINWPIKKPILSPKDKKNITLKEFEKLK